MMGRQQPRMTAMHQHLLRAYCLVKPGDLGAQPGRTTRLRAPHPMYPNWRRYLSAKHAHRQQRAYRLGHLLNQDDPHRIGLSATRDIVLNMTAMTSYAASLDDVRAARLRIAPYAHCTPVLTCSTLDKLAGQNLFFKCENFQKVGAFKFRGACNAVFRLRNDVAARGVATHSSGNFAQALALAASIRGIAAHIVMPTTAPAVKRRAVEAYGAAVYSCKPTLAARETCARDIIRQTEATLIHPYDHPDIIAGQGTVALELMEQVEGLDAIIAPVGGGGLIGGICIAAKGLDPVIRVFAGEPTGADDAARSMAAGRLVPQSNPSTIADGLLTSLGEHTWPIIRDHVERVITVSDEQTVSAMRLVWERMKIIIEPSAAVAVAAALDEDFRSYHTAARVGVVLTGGNVDLDRKLW